MSFFVHAKGAIRWAAIVFVLTAVQAELGYLSHDVPISGAAHGLNALVLFGCALITARRPLAPKSSSADAAAEPESATRAG